ncbi:MAG: hypothetical protein AAF292_00265 [Pseudomonadota bacterium]
MLVATQLLNSSISNRFPTLHVAHRQIGTVRFVGNSEHVLQPGTKFAQRRSHNACDWGKGKPMKIDKSKLLGFSNQSDEKNDTMVGTKGGGSGRRRRRWWKWWW